MLINQTCIIIIILNNFFYLLQKFLRKLPGGIFGPENEEALFEIINIENLEDKRDRIHRFLFIYIFFFFQVWICYVLFSFKFKFIKCIIENFH